MCEALGLIPHTPNEKETISVPKQRSICLELPHCLLPCLAWVHSWVSSPKLSQWLLMKAKLSLCLLQCLLCLPPGLYPHTYAGKNIRLPQGAEPCTPRCREKRNENNHVSRSGPLPSSEPGEKSAAGVVTWRCGGLGSAAQRPAGLNPELPDRVHMGLTGLGSHYRVSTSL